MELTTGSCKRLKDLKQREFARNVASKSWKDEKKQEKALKRLHQLAELRKQSECSISGNGPLLKAPRLVMEKQQLPDGIFLYKGSKFTASSQRTATSEGQGFSSSLLEKQQLIISRQQSPTERSHALGNQISHAFPDSTSTSQRAGVSFSFSKKVPLKLESSASVFSENSEEGNDCSESPNLCKIKQALEGCRSGTLLEEDMKASLDKGSPITPEQTDLDDSASNHIAAKPKMLKENNKCSDRGLEEKVSAHPSFSKVKIQLSNLDFSGSFRETEQESKLNESEQLLETLISPPCQASNFFTQLNTYKHSNAHLPDQLPELPQQPAPELACSSNINDSPGVIKRERSSESSETTKTNVEMLPREAMVKEAKPQALPFLHVVSKDGTTALQWPTELLLFTKTEPCISYGCNPLYFDFRLSLNHRDGKKHETNKASCKEHSINKTADENEASGLIKHKQMSNEQDNQLLKPKKMKGSLNPRKAKQKSESDIGKEINENGQKCIADYLNENIPKVPAYLGVSQKDYMAEKSLHTTTLRRPLKHHFHSYSRSSERSSSSRISRASSSGSFSKETDISDNKTKEDAERGSNTELGKAETAHYNSLNVNGQSEISATCSSETLAKDIHGKRKSLAAKLLLERVQPKKNQEHMHHSERFSNTCGVELKDHSRSHFALQFSSSVDDIAMLPLPEKLLRIGKNDMGHNEISSLETSVKKNNFEASAITNVALSTETKEELHDVNMDSNQAEGSSDSLCDNAIQKCDDTVNDLEVYSKSTSIPLTQQPITFSPEEVDKYRLLQLQAQQHMQKQLLAKHLKVLPAQGPAAFSATPAVPALPVPQHTTVTTIHHTLLQRFAVSSS
ncbi:PREDICTED: zinc finger protein 804B, partial [Leptosomus discolor]|uniref:zinc finger protein 804B n=1 Tax=Leptosomus discolor TaxID=188344 RepID=UPI0005229505